MSNLSSLANWPPANGPTTVQVNRTAATITLNGSIAIDAPAAVVWDILRNVSYYPDWFYFVLGAEVTSQPSNLSSSDDPGQLYLGTKFNLTILQPDNQTYQLPQVVSDYSTPDQPSQSIPQSLANDSTFYSNLSNLYRIAWITDPALAGDSLRSQRFNDIIITSNSTSLLRSWELQAGPAANASSKSLLDAGYLQFLATIKEQSEDTNDDEGGGYEPDDSFDPNLDDIDGSSSNSSQSLQGLNATTAGLPTAGLPTASPQTSGGNRGGNSQSNVPDAAGFTGP